VSSCSLASSSVSCCKPQKSQEKNPLDCVGMGLGDFGVCLFARLGVCYCGGGAIPIAPSRIDKPTIPCTIFSLFRCFARKTSK
jgi:hypothetical protein